MKYKGLLMFVTGVAATAGAAIGYKWYEDKHKTPLDKPARKPKYLPKPKPANTTTKPATTEPPTTEPTRPRVNIFDNLFDNRVSGVTIYD